MLLASTAAVVVTSPDWWAWLTEFTIPLIGVLLASAIAYLAVRQTFHASRLDREERARMRRAEFALAVDRYLDPRSDLADVGTPAVRVLTRREGALRAAAATAGDDAFDIAEWVSREHHDLLGKHIADGFTGSSDQHERERERHDFESQVEYRVRRWVSTSVMHFGPIDLGPFGSEE